MAEYTETFQRKEVKYRLSAAQVQALKAALEGRMALDAYGRTTICSTYYDNATRSMIARSLEKPFYKEKLRLRTYGQPSETSPVFVELKKKQGGIVYKRRIATSLPAAQMIMRGVRYESAISLNPMADAGLEAASHTDHNKQIAAELAACVRRNGPVYASVAIECQREAFAALPEAEDAAGVRITFDESICYRDLFNRQAAARRVALLSPGEAIVEVKVPGSYPMWLVRVLSDIQAYPTSFSKYGEAYLRISGASRPAAYAHDDSAARAAGANVIQMRGAHARHTDGSAQAASSAPRPSYATRARHAAQTAQAAQAVQAAQATRPTQAPRAADTVRPGAPASSQTTVLM